MASSAVRKHVATTPVQSPFKCISKKPKVHGDT